MADVLGNSVEIFKKLLQEDETAKNTLKERGINSRAIEYFDIGATSKEGSFYYNIKKEYNYSDDVLEDAGLLLANGNSIETFKNSIIIPLKDQDGRIISLSARRLDDHPAKYINLPHRKIFDFYGVEMLANRHLFNGCDNLDTPLFICEGQIDTIILQQAGLPAVGILGVNSMREVMFGHLRWFKTIIFCFDNDFPGHQATKKMASYIKHHYPNMPLYYVQLDDEKEDINKYFMKGKTAEDLLGGLVLMKNVKPKSFKVNKTGKKHTDEKLMQIKNLQIKDFVESVEKTVQWSKHGRLLKTKCPFPNHADTINSFTIYRETNTYFCFGCGSGGDLVNFCMEYFGTNFKTALNILSKWSGK